MNVWLPVTPPAASMNVMNYSERHYMSVRRPFAPPAASMNGTTVNRVKCFNKVNYMVSFNLPLLFSVCEKHLTHYMSVTT